MAFHGRVCDCDDCYDARRLKSVRWCMNGACCGKPAAPNSDYCCEECKEEDAPWTDGISTAAVRS